MVSALRRFSCSCEYYIDLFDYTVGDHRNKWGKRDFSADVFKHIMQLPGKHIDDKHSGNLLSHFTNDIHNLDGIIGSSLINLIKLPFIYMAVFIYLLQISWKLALVCVFVAPIAMVSGVIFGVMLRKNNRLTQDLVARMNVLLNETFSGLFVIRSFLMEKVILPNM